MPIYEYECPKCGNLFEEWGKAADSHQEEPCPKCGALSPRVISRTSFVLKGDGWYVSDYGYRKGITEDSGGKAETPAPATPTAPATQGDKSVAVSNDKTVAKTETAPAAKPAPKTAKKQEGAKKKPEAAAKPK